MQRKSALGRLARTILICGVCVFFRPIPFSSAPTPATYYVLGGGGGDCSGSDWANAAGKIPATLYAGDVVYIGNSETNLADSSTTPCAGESSHVFSTSGASGNPVIIKAATTSDHGTSTGWSSSYGVDVTPKITWSNSLSPSSTLIAPFWDFCASYYDVDGEVGSGDTIGVYGFYFKSAARMYGFIRSESNQCGQATMTNLSFAHIEIDGVSPNSTGNGAHAGGVGLDFGSSVSTTASVGPISITNSYIHDVPSPLNSVGRVLGLTLTHDYFERNFSDANYHAEGIGTQASNNDPSQIGIQNLDVHDDVFQNIQGTAFIVCLAGVCDGWKIYNSIFYYTSDWDSICEYGDTTATCGVSAWTGATNTDSYLANGAFYGNTLAFIHLKPGHAGADNAGFEAVASGSTSNTVENNLWYNCTIGGAVYDGSTGSYPTTVSHDYNTLLNTGYATTGMVLSSHETQLGASGQTITGGASDPFTNSASYDFHLVADMSDAADSGTAQAQGISLASPYNSDYDGATRGADGTWERGAYEFKTDTTTQKPQPPGSLRVTSVQ